MKARYGDRVCECCKEQITHGSQFTMHHGRPWKTEHLVEYLRRRKGLAASGR